MRGLVAGPNPEIRLDRGDEPKDPEHAEANVGDESLLGQRRQAKGPQSTHEHGADVPAAHPAVQAEGAMAQPLVQLPGAQRKRGEPTGKVGGEPDRYDGAVVGDKRRPKPRQDERQQRVAGDEYRQRRHHDPPGSPDHGSRWPQARRTIPGSSPSENRRWRTPDSLTDMTSSAGPPRNEPILPRVHG